MPLKQKIVKGCGYETYKTKKKREKEIKEKARTHEETAAAEEQEAPVPLVTHVNNILQSFSSDFEVYINKQQSYTSNGFYAHKSYISNYLKKAISEYKVVLRYAVYENKIFWWNNASLFGWTFYH